MGVIKKKTATRGTEGGVKFVCDVCSADITSTVRPVPFHPLRRCQPSSLLVPLPDERRNQSLAKWNFDKSHVAC